jgi:LEA14-like dessication related protein
MKRAFVLTVIVLIALIVSFVVFLASLKTPEVRLKSLSIEDIESVDVFIIELPRALLIAVVFEVNNPNIVGITVERIDYVLYVNDIALAQGRLKEPFTVGANSTSKAKSTLRLSVASSIQALISAIVQRDANISVSGIAYVSVPFAGLQRVSFYEDVNIEHII